MPVIQEVDRVSPLALTIFGITGDLSGRYLLPALYDLAEKNLLPRPFRIVGITRRHYTVEQLLERVSREVAGKGLEVNKNVLEELGKKIELLEIDFKRTADFKKIKSRLDEIENEEKICMSRIYYMAVPAQLFKSIIGHMGKGGLQHNCPHGTGQSRILLEKPFGHDTESAEKLSKTLRGTFNENQIFRIDHFLAKETSQNILTFRFENALFRAVWNNRHIKSITVSANETIGIEGRANFYEQTGALRDMIQSHVLQMLALAAMDIPDKMTPESIHDKKLELLKSVTRANPAFAARGQYESYKYEAGNPRSKIETYAALKLTIDNDRWRGVPIILRTGKSLDEKSTDITVVFSDDNDQSADNTLIIRVAPNEGISLHLRAKRPGFDHKMQDVSMDFDYHSAFAEHHKPTAYERILIDAFRGDNTLFSSTDEVIASWKIINPLLEAWLDNDSGLEVYKQGSKGPLSALKLVDSVSENK